MGSNVLPSDFYNAFQRHWKDAEYLYADSRWSNADQLYAFSAECGLKCLMQAFGMTIPILSINKVHADKIWARYETYRTGNVGTGYVLSQPNPFDDWDISWRYAHDSNFNQAVVDVHKNGTKIVKELIQKAILEGRLIA